MAGFGNKSDCILRVHLVGMAQTEPCTNLFFGHLCLPAVDNDDDDDAAAAEL